MATYNGHRNWNYWNVALWFRNDESLYRLARDYKRRYRTITESTRALLSHLQNMGIENTPDGARYNLSNIRAAIKEL